MSAAGRSLNRARAARTSLRRPPAALILSTLAYAWLLWCCAHFPEAR